ncbi:uncharacterized protein LOC118438874 isoform X2 [Folsomia candida]|uniref:uncharacterized protein LOC118438874 isoform X2 n=1 Tax=Folsomia candida TaxID=158441 RepID=UPI0016053F2D|nr:uncharacterized protein LOC118438874 isoform X2 [Folsomia candida]
MSSRVGYFLRFGLPLGSCLILCGIVQTVTSLYEVCVELPSVLVTHWDEPVVQIISETPSVIVFSVLRLLQLFADIVFLLVGAIVKGSRLLLISWVVVTISSIVTHDVAWFLYSYSEGGISSIYIYKAAYFVVVATIFHVYIVSIGFRCVSCMKENLEEVHPIGKGVVQIGKYFAHHAKIGTRLILTSELILNLDFFLIEILPIVLFDEYYSDHERYQNWWEDVALRGVRVVLGITGLVILSKGKETWVKYWCIPYLFTVFLRSEPKQTL